MRKKEEQEEKEINTGNEQAEAVETSNEDIQDASEEKKDEAKKEETSEEKDSLEAAHEEVEQLKDKYLRAVAEFDNYKKRTLKEKTELILNGAEKTVSAIFPILDDMERALANAQDTDDVAALKEGMDLIYKKFIKTLEGLGVKKIEAEGKDFDVDYHEAVAMVPEMDDEKKGKVIDCVQTGYTLNDKVIRHAKVAVGQ